MGEVWPIQLVAPEAARVIADWYVVDPALLLAPSRGRGPKPPVETVLPRKLLAYVTVSLTDTNCAAVARALGLHRDTVHTHVAELRALMVDDEVEALVVLLARLVAAALRRRGEGPAIASVSRRTRFRRRAAARASATHPTSGTAAKKISGPAHA